MSRFITILAAALVLGGLSAVLFGHVRLRHPTNGTALFWQVPTNVAVTINSTGPDDISDGSHETALRLAIDEWNSIAGSAAQLVENTSAAQQARTDWIDTGIHLILFDEDNSSGFFPGGSGTVAVTPLLFGANGVILDADILFNGEDFQFTTAGQAFRFDVQDVGTHELGHFLGLDHSGWASATMYPFVDTTVVLHRSVSSDDEHGLRSLYPTQTAGAISGTILRASDGTPVEGAQVVARAADGRPQAAVLSAANGTFSIQRLGPGTYTVYAAPLDSPVSVSNLGSWFGGRIDTDFEPGTYVAMPTITLAETPDLGTLMVGADVSLNLGTNFDAFPKRLQQGLTTAVALTGSGLVPGSTLTASDPDVTLSAVNWFSTSVSFQAGVTASEPLGNVDLMVQNPSGRVSILTAALEITPPNPTVSSVNPSIAAASGGSMVTISGSGFASGLRVVLGDRIYSEGAAQVSLIDANTLSLVLQVTAEGQHDVVVIDSTGVEGRLAAGFQAVSSPVVASSFPAAGSTAGGTQMTLFGSGFLAGVSVRIDGVTQTNVVLCDSNQITVTTNSAAAGGPLLLEVENADGGLATLAGAFSYVAQADPGLTVITPASGAAGGGSVVTITGSGFTPSTDVVFGADATSGTGGVSAANVTFVDAQTLTVTTPSHAPGLTSVMLRDTGTNQALLVPAAFTFQGSSGGGCVTRPFATPRGPWEALLSAGWLALLAGFLGWRAHWTRRAPNCA